MPTFHITAIDPKTSEEKLFLYDTTASTLTTDDFTPVMARDATRVTVFPERMSIASGKENIKTLKISFGLSCNYSCTYCSQRFVPHADSTSPDDIPKFLEQLKNADVNPQRIEFWGGEPLVYWKTVQPMANELRKLYPDAIFSMITNGSLLDLDKNAWLDEMGFSVGLSHDGPGYHVRGLDPLDDPEKKAAIMDLYGRLAPKGRMSVNAMMHKGNPSRAAVQTWLKREFGDKVKIGEGAFVDPYDEGGLDSMLDDYTEYRKNAFAEIRSGQVSSFTNITNKILSFIEGIKVGKPITAVGQKCGMDQSDTVAVDLHGDVITCQNVSSKSVAPNGQSHKVGSISNLSGVIVDSATHWSDRAECSACPMLHLCQGSCMFLSGPLWESACDAAYSDAVPLFAAAFEVMTGTVPVYINGDFREDRRDLWGNGLGNTQKKVANKIIKIAQA